MNGKLSLRLIKKKDLKTLARVYCKAYSDTAEEHWTQGSAYALLNYWFDRQPDLSFLAEIDGKIVGAFLAGVKPWWDGNHLVDGEVFVDPDYQKKGVGTALSELMYRSAVKKYNAKRFDAITFKKTKHPLSWYKKYGFSEVDNWTVISGDLKKVLKKMRMK